MAKENKTHFTRTQIKNFVNLHGIKSLKQEFTEGTDC